MSRMGGAIQMIYMLSWAAFLFFVVTAVAFLVTRLFSDKKTRRRIMVAAIAIYGIAFVSYFGFIAFILCGNLNR
jgi:MFS family permease